MFSLQSMRAMNSITYSCNVLAVGKKLLINLKHNNIICNKNKSYLNTLSRNLRSRDWREKCRLRLYLQNAEENMRSRREDQKNAEEQKHVGICK